MSSLMLAHSVHRKADDYVNESMLSPLWKLGETS